MALLEKTLSKSKQLSLHSITELQNVWKKSRHLKPKEVLLDFNCLDTNLYFVADGCVRLFIVDNKGDETSLGFGYEGTLITSFQSFIEEKPSQLSIVGVLDTHLISISKIDLKRLINENTEISHWYQSVLEITLNGHIQRQIELLTLSPKDRYEVFEKRSRHLVNKIPLKLIASYLMMTPETLSRIRSKIS